MQLSICSLEMHDSFLDLLILMDSLVLHVDFGPLPVFSRPEAFGGFVLGVVLNMDCLCSQVEYT